MISNINASEGPSDNHSGMRAKRTLFLLAAAVAVVGGLSAFFVIGAAAGLVMAGMTG